jgi:hypothetical protein
MNSPTRPILYAVPKFTRLVAWGGLVFSLIMLAASLAVIFLENWEAGWISALVWLVSVLVWSYLLNMRQRRVRLDAAHLTLHTTTQMHVLPYASITGLQARFGLLILSAEGKNYILHFHHPDLQAQLANELTARVPTLREAQSRWRSDGLPCVIHAPILIPLFTCLMGAGIAIVGAGTLVFALGMDQPDRGLDRAAALLSGGVILLAGLFFVLYFLFGFIWRYTFEQEIIRLDFIFSSKTYDPTAIKAMQVVEEITLVRGLNRRRCKLRLDFGADSYLDIEPNGFSFPMDYSAEREKYLANELLARLANHYIN